MIEEIKTYLPILVPVILLNFILIFVALKHLLKYPKVKYGSKVLWIFIILFIQIIGPILYLCIGKGEEE